MIYRSLGKVGSYGLKCFMKSGLGTKKEQTKRGLYHNYSLVGDSGDGLKLYMGCCM